MTPQNDCRIGYRHRGPHGANKVNNAAFADGHVEAIDGLKFPQSKSTGNPNAKSKDLAEDEVNRGFARSGWRKV